MFDLKYLVLMAAAAALLPRGNARSLDLSDMINKTVCAIKVHYDVNLERIPQRIKMLKCASKTNSWCLANNIDHHHCCHHKHEMECVEMQDTVLVFDKRENKTQTLEVSVGCACMIRDSSKAAGVPDSPP